jgi:hypothetical protein
MIYLVIWILLSILVGLFWQKKGRSFKIGSIISILLSPLIGFLIGVIIKTDYKMQEAQELSTGVNRKCPMCAEMIKAEAKLCRYCGHKFEKPLSSGDNLSVHQEVYRPDNVENWTDIQKRILADGRCPECNDTIDANDFMCKSCRFDYSHLQNK